jgi:hypothetical protein
LVASIVLRAIGRSEEIVIAESLSPDLMQWAGALLDEMRLDMPRRDLD